MAALRVRLKRAWKRLDSLFEALRGACALLPDKRRGRNCHYTMADIGMAAFSVS